jgi:hypothetical protein
MKGENYPEEYIVAKPLLQLGIQCDTQAKMAILAPQSVSS